MASPTLLSGTVTHLDRMASTSGEIRNGRGQIRTDHATSFRLDNRPVVFRGLADLGDGEPAVAAGYDRNGQFSALAVRNDSTGLIYHTTSLPYLLLGGFLLGIGLLMMLAGVSFGFVLAAAGALIARPGVRARQARALLVASRAPAHARGAHA